ncbi:MAG TPA: RNA polymerase sigma-70 factor, partial [Puia sp.]|nr:RNA polymerase sigma-70 factor [Puia sp.]
ALPYDERTLLAEVATGSETAFRMLYDQYHSRIVAFARFLTHDENLALDLTQDIFVKIWTRRAELAQVHQWNAWLRTVVRNHAYTWLQRRALERSILLEMARRQPAGAATTEQTVLDQEYQRLLAAAVESLPPQQKKVWQLSQQPGVHQDEIAAELCLSPDTVKNHKKAALRKIREYIARHTEDLILLAIALFLKD